MCLQSKVLKEVGTTKCSSGMFVSCRVVSCRVVRTYTPLDNAKSPCDMQICCAVLHGADDIVPVFARLL